MTTEPTTFQIASGIRRNYIWSVPLFLVLVIIANAFVVYYVTQERYIYFWDWSRSWSSFREISASILPHPISTARSIIYQIRHDDYNPLVILPLIPVMWVVGFGRLAYISSITNVYVLPSAIAMSLFVQRMLHPIASNHYLHPSWLATATILLLHPLWMPVLRGYPDVVGIAVISGILLLNLAKPLGEQTFISLIATGLLLCILVLLRRWYAFWVVAFFPALAVAHGLDIYCRHGIAWRHYATPLRNLIIIGMIFIVSLFSFATQFALRAISTDYSDIYSAYRASSSLLETGAKLGSYFGLIILAISLVGLGWLAAWKKTMIFGVFLTIHSALTFILFARTQDFSDQHYYLLFVPIGIGIAVVVVHVSSRITGRLCRIAWVGLIFAILLGNSSIVLSPGAAGLSTIFGRLAPKARSYPLIRDDIEAVERLLNRLGELEAQKPGDIYILASSFILNSEIVQNSCNFGPRRRFFCDRILRTNDVDKRDGFPRQFLRASYLVVASPTQYHMRAHDQRVIGVLAREVLEPRGIGLSFNRLAEGYKLDNEVIVSVYEKVKPFERTDLDALADEFNRYYPDKRHMFDITTRERTDAN